MKTNKSFFEVNRNPFYESFLSFVYLRALSFSGEKRMGKTFVLLLNKHDISNWIMDSSEAKPKIRIVFIHFSSPLCSLIYIFNRKMLNMIFKEENSGLFSLFLIQNSTEFNSGFCLQIESINRKEWFQMFKRIFTTQKGLACKQYYERI